MPGIVVSIHTAYNYCVLVYFSSQLSYSPRSLSECGLTDGEATERLWSYLRRLAKITKEMRPSHRIDVLTSGLLHYASKARLKLGIHV